MRRFKHPQQLEQTILICEGLVGDLAVAPTGRDARRGRRFLVGLTGAFALLSLRNCDRKVHGYGPHDCYRAGTHAD